MLMKKDTSTPYAPAFPKVGTKEQEEKSNQCVLLNCLLEMIAVQKVKKRQEVLLTLKQNKCLTQDILHIDN